MTEAEVIKPQPKQEAFLSSSADIVIYGGAAGGGKTWALLMEPLRHVNNGRFGAVVFRRTIPEITREGGIWDEATEIYPRLGAEANLSDHFYKFPSGAKVTFTHLQNDKELEAWRSSQIPLIEFDQLETFDETQFWYMFSRNRSLCGVRPYIRATANPQPGWLAELLAWWIGEDGYAIPERSGKIRWFVRENNKVEWADTPAELKEKFPLGRPQSLTFILSTIYDNPILMEKDPDYLAKLMSLNFVDRERLLGSREKGGNWKIKEEAGTLFNKEWFDIVDAMPAGGEAVRFWDLAATLQKFSKRGKKKNDPDYTASCAMKMVNEEIYIFDITNERLSPAMADAAMLNIGKQDGRRLKIRWEMEGGSSGKRDAAHIAKLLKGFDACGVPPKGDKIERAKPLAAQALAGNVHLLRGPWNKMFLDHMHGQPDLPHDDIMDACSGAYDELTAPQEVSIEWV